MRSQYREPEVFFLEQLMYLFQGVFQKPGSSPASEHKKLPSKHWSGRSRMLTRRISMLIAGEKQRTASVWTNEQRLQQHKSAIDDFVSAYHIRTELSFVLLQSLLISQHLQ
ncbi:hypothetical protein CDAR_219651 [Caerostris darwini]|uniref:Uncharacterized protein n=1 Tax=Caerostris darwini TaxID=1538125 RepID=A0AAV4TE04_9ARAC|nr:hypothetical protein CDAR_219651 [Caerostris darwini]